jgi:predicted MPP superfamily phosphohydrolase
MPQKYSTPVYVRDIPWWQYDIAIGLMLAGFGIVHVLGHLFLGFSPITFLSGLAFSVIVYGAFIEPRLLKVTRYAVGTGEKALKVAFISDIHVGPYKGRRWVEKLVRRTMALEPDLILLGGDFLLKEADALPMLEPLKALKAPLGVYAIMGNHDEWVSSPEAHAWFAASGIPLLENRSVQAGPGVSVAGADDDWYGDTELETAFKGLPPDDLAIVMLHNPDLAPPAAALLKTRPGKTVFFSGHTHAGQIRLPWIGSVAKMPHHLGRKFDRGVFAFDGIPLIIGAGTGESGPRVRLFCRPEIVLAELRQ